jgi:hypothetical protein
MRHLESFSLGILNYYDIMLFVDKILIIIAYHGNTMKDKLNIDQRPWKSESLVISLVCK